MAVDHADIQVPIFEAASLTGHSQPAFFVGLAASVDVGISMGLAEAPFLARPS